jgi:hypothetical protein
VNVTAGGQLSTYIARLPDPRGPVEVPLVSILKDTLGDDNVGNDRIRYVYSFGYTRPSLWQRFSAAVPFFYRRAGGDLGRTLAPKPILDMAHPAQGTLPRLLGAAVQSSVLDPLGMVWRSSTRAYRSRTNEYRSMQLFRTLEVLRTASVEGMGLSSEELAPLKGRLVLSNQLLGGLVTDRYASAAWDKKREAWAMNRGRNWELLRQRAEQNGLYFQPLRIGSDDLNFALLWIEQGSMPGEFDSRFLSISDPRNDERIRTWKGYSELWSLDESGSRVSETGAGIRQARMIPLALYALDHPKVPLLILDFRSPGKMKRREMAWRISDDLATGVLGLTGWGNWPYMAGKKTWMFVRGRHGGTVDRMARLRAYVQLRQSLVMDSHLAPALRAELTKGVERLGWNPLEEDFARESAFARRQYASLLEASGSGLARDLDRERLAEIRDLVHSPASRLGLRLASLATLGIYRHRDELTPARLEAVDAERRQATTRKEQALLNLLPPAAPPALSSGGGQ